MSKCPTDCQNYKPKPPEPELTAGEKWVGKEGFCVLGPSGICAPASDCAVCRKRLAKAFDLGRESAEREITCTTGRAMTAEQWEDADRFRWGLGTVEGPRVIKLGREDWLFVCKKAIANYRKLNKGKVI